MRVVGSVSIEASVDQSGNVWLDVAGEGLDETGKPVTRWGHNPFASTDAAMGFVRSEVLASFGAI